MALTRFQDPFSTSFLKGRKGMDLETRMKFTPGAIDCEYSLILAVAIVWRAKYTRVCISPAPQIAIAKIGDYSQSIVSFGAVYNVLCCTMVALTFEILDEISSFRCDHSSESC